MREFIIGENDGGQRLDKFISKLMPRLSKSMMYKGFRKNCVRLNDKHVKDGAVFVNAGDNVKLYFKDEFFESERDFDHVKYDLDIVYEDENIIIINKPVGVLSHADDKGEGAGVAEMVKSYLADKGEYDPKRELTFKPALCNRLDRNTSGLLIAAKNAEALRNMNDQIRRGNIRKFYNAVVEGYPPPTGHLEARLARDNKVTRVADEGKSASLSYRVLEERNGYALLEIELHTGRTHQIRAQFGDLGYPLAGDTKYGGHGKKFRQTLCSSRLEFYCDGFFEYLNNKEFKVTPPFLKDF